MKKILVLVLALVMVLGMAACGETATPASTTEPKSNATEAPSTEVTEAPGADATDAPEQTTEAPVETTAPETEAPAVVTEADAVAKIGDTFFASVSDAFDASKDGDTVVITKDFETEDAVYTLATGKVNLDGQGHTITANVGLMAWFTVDGFEMNVKDLNVKYTEATYSVPNGTTGDAVINVENGGIVTLENCEFTALWGDCLNVNDGGELTIKSGKYIIDPTNDSLQSNLICINKTGKVIVQNGEFSRLGTGSNKRALNRVNGNGGYLEINGGTWEGGCGRLVFLNGNGNGPDAEEHRKIVVNDGIFTFGVDNAPAGFAFDPAINMTSAQGGEITINGGTFEIKPNCDMIMIGANKAKLLVTVNGGTFINGAGAMFDAAKLPSTSKDETTGEEKVTLGGTIDIKGGTFTNVTGTMFTEVTEKECLLISGGSFNTANATEANNLKAFTSGTVEIK